MILEKTHFPHLNTVPFLSPHTMLVTFIVLYYKWMVVFFTATKADKTVSILGNKYKYDMSKQTDLHQNI